MYVRAFAFRFLGLYAFFLAFRIENDKKKTQKTWSHLLGPVCIFLDREWKDGQLVEIKKDHVVYSISGDSTQYIISKDEVYHIVRKHNNVTTSDKTGECMGKNPMIFGPDGKNLYGK